MDFIIVFFRDILSGPLYIVICVINSILICSCIGYLGEQYLNKKNATTQYNNTYAAVGNNTGVSAGQSVPGAAPVAPQATIPGQTQVNNNQVQ
ncbi:MAG: hypothetical protein IJ193_04635 [Bacilli bacterium]|nr:hypothetical protein [Bacilli bacterium]